LRAFQDNAAKNSQPDIVSAGRGPGADSNWSCHRRVRRAVAGQPPWARTRAVDQGATLIGRWSGNACRGVIGWWRRSPSP